MALGHYRLENNVWVSLDGSSDIGTQPQNTILFGSNLGGGGPNANITSRLSQFGRVPCSRLYYGMNALPTSMGTLETSNSPEKRTQVSFKVDPSSITNGSSDSNIRSYIQSFPAGWTLFLTYWHEPNSELNSGEFTPTAYKNAHYYISNLIANTATAAHVIPMPNYSGPHINAFDNSWVVDVGSMSANAVLSIDQYGNPSGGGGYDSAYPTPTSVYSQMSTMLSTLGWDGDGKWGITEFNTPRRTFDQDETQRSQWISDTVTWLSTPSTSGVGKPFHIFIWEGNGVQWDQNFYTTLLRDTWKTINMTSV